MTRIFICLVEWLNRRGIFWGLLSTPLLREWTIRCLFLGRNICHRLLLVKYRSWTNYRMWCIVGLLIFWPLGSCLRNSSGVWIPSILRVVWWNLCMFGFWLGFWWSQERNILEYLFQFWNISIFFWPSIPNDKGVNSHGQYVRTKHIFSILHHCVILHLQKSWLL